MAFPTTLNNTVINAIVDCHQGGTDLEQQSENISFCKSPSNAVASYIGIEMVRRLNVVITMHKLEVAVGIPVCIPVDALGGKRPPNFLEHCPRNTTPRVRTSVVVEWP